ncbi:MAG: glycosyltransferase family 4 protein [Alphaproteobacteria bacterium]|nr:glycosyltransferase family 4 protein [Alphaproteobacteria bacterium]
MHYVLLDDSINFDGYTSGRRAIGGAERAFAALAGALVKRGHSVTVFNKIQYPTWCEGAKWRPLDDFQSLADADVVIAYRKPSLLGSIRQTKHRVLWWVGPVDPLNGDGAKQFFDSLKPSIVFSSAAQKSAFKGTVKSAVVAPGVRAPFWEVETEVNPYPEVGHDMPIPARSPDHVPPPHAVVTTHPQQGLAWTLDIWTKIIHPQVPAARLAIYSASLHKGMKGEGVAPELAPILELVKSSVGANVVVMEPRGDKGMADVYRNSRVHLYPSFSQDLVCWTLRDSQAAGLPAVARVAGGTEDVVVNGQSGFLVPDAMGFGNCAVQILTNDGVYRNLSQMAGSEARRRTWEAAAADLETFVASLGDAPSA